MQGLMMDMPLLISGLIQYAADYHGEAEIVAREIEGDIHRYHLCRGSSAHQAHGAGAQAARHEARRPRRHAGLEYASPFRDVLRGARHGLCAAHRQSATVSRTARLHHQPRRRPTAVHRPRHAADRRGDRAAAEDGRSLRRDVLARTDAGDEACERPLLRRALGNGERCWLRLAGVRRKVRIHHLLHVGHDGQSQGRDLFAPRRHCFRP